MNNKNLIVVGVICGIVALMVLMGVGMYFSYSNSEIRLRNQITAKQRDNQNEMDNMKKKISQTVQVTDLQKDMLMGVIVGNAQARKSGAGTLATMVREAVPKVDVKIFKNLMNIITSGRDSWTMRQKELLDLKREHDNLLDVAPSSWFVGSRPHIEVVIVTSTATQEAFKTGVDDDSKLK